MKPAKSYQPDLFPVLDIVKGRENRDRGLRQAVDHADEVTPKWSERVWTIFKGWLLSKPAGYFFLIEDFRLWCDIHKKIETPPSKRSFGFLSVRAAKENLIYQKGTAKVKNPTARCANAAVWVKM
jgi:hypothetical protein